MIVSVAEPPPGAAIVFGESDAVAPEGNPETESATDELKLPFKVDVIVEVPLAPCAIESDAGDEVSEKNGPNLMSITGCNSMPFGATPCCPSR